MTKPEGVSLEFDNHWKTEAIKIAMHEQLNTADEIDMKTLFKRAKLIYIEGYKNNIHAWHMTANSIMKVEQILNEDKEDEKKEPTKEEPKKIIEIKDIPENMKQCPDCGELVNKNWDKHSYKSNGEKCGHVFSQ
jgi:hypothetical protein